ncbi:hypothetical protein [Leptolyngbya sp. FACHB-8]|uniref:hypothetical protein n=1 Tax=unclassified Leptolyngbya TaxID=2650499 RepID=UPI0016876291|nr:hypothetical protein [Leptolyngbya sp. FACHB-8]MBD1910316.1 hypothetical protein [Leptolyngbya sp. FACHB-8]
MRTALCVEDLQGLQETLRGLLEGLPLEFQCSAQEGALMILGKHSADLGLEPQDIFRRLERHIQALQLHFVQQARLYLQIAGESQPYAYRFFLIQPPPPPRPTTRHPLAVGATPVEEAWGLLDEEFARIATPTATPLGEEEPWELSDEELDGWIHELVGVAASDARVFAPDVEDSTDEPEKLAEETVSLIPWKDPEDRLAEREVGLPLVSDTPLLTPLPPREFPLNSRWMVAGGAIALGIAGGTYGLSRPCVLDTCPELQSVQQWNQEAIQRAEQATDAEDIEEAKATMQRAIATLETIPTWSRFSGEAHTLRQSYGEQQQTLEYLSQIAEMAQTASDRSQKGPHNSETWQEITALWHDAINRLDAIPPENPFYRTAQRQKQQYEENLERHRQSLTSEEAAQAFLNMAKQAIQIAEARQQIAQSLDQWQLVRVTWQVVVNRLREVPAGTYAAMDAQRLLESYQPRLIAAIAQVDQEQKATGLLQQATQAAQAAQQASQQSNWQGAIAAWTDALRYTEQIPPNTASSVQGQELTRTYTTSMEQAKAQLETSMAISLDVDRACHQELQKCRLLIAGNAIQLQLSPEYMSAITTARASGNRSLQAVVAEHQLALRHTLESLAARFRRPVEVYDDQNALLDRHLPPSASATGAVTPLLPSAAMTPSPPPAATSAMAPSPSTEPTPSPSSATATSTPLPSSTEPAPSPLSTAGTGTPLPSPPSARAAGATVPFGL